MSELAIVFWNQDEPTTKAATTFHVFEGQIIPTDLMNRNGMAISEFFRGQGIKIEQYMELFPRHIVQSDPETYTEDGKLKTRPQPRLSWDAPLKWQTISGDKESLKKLSVLLKMPISVFTFRRHEDKIPQFLHRIGG